MLPCNYCSSEIVAETALLTQDLYAKQLAFCSVACQELWIDHTFTPAPLTGVAASGQ